MQKCSAAEPVGHRTFALPAVTWMEGFADYEQPRNCWLPNLISMLLWSSVNLPDSRLCLPCGQSMWIGAAAAVPGSRQLLLDATS